MADAYVRITTDIHGSDVSKQDMSLEVISPGGTRSFCLTADGADRLATALRTAAAAVRACDEPLVTSDGD